MRSLLVQTLAVVVSLVATAIGALAQQVRFRDEVFPQVNRENAVVYGSALNQFTSQQEALLLDYYEPAGDTWTERPAVVVVHGGGFTTGGRATSNFEDLCMRFARRGFVAVSIDYRLAPLGMPISMSIVRDAVHDYQAAVRWLRANAALRSIDVDRIAAIGSSAGAVTLLESAYCTHGEGNSGNPGHSSRVHATVDLWGASADPMAMQSTHPPVFITHGTADLVIPFGAAQHLHAGAMSAGLPNEFHPIQGAGHAPFSQYLALHFDDTLTFAWEHLELARTAGLTVRPGYGSPGLVEVDQFGLAGSFVLVAFGDTPSPTLLPGLGELCFDPAGFALVASTSMLPSVPRISSSPTSLVIPSGFVGFTVHWQAVELGSVQLLTNCLTTAF